MRRAVALSMPVVWSDRHHLHEPGGEFWVGVRTPGSELPERAIDKALAFGEIPSGLPFIKKEGVRLLKTDYRTSEDAAEKLPAGLINYYRQNYAEIFTKVNLLRPMFNSLLMAAAVIASS